MVDGEIVLDEERWRPSLSWEAANGIFMFGWTTAIVIAAFRHFYATTDTLAIYKDLKRAVTELVY